MQFYIKSLFFLITIGLITECEFYELRDEGDPPRHIDCTSGITTQFLFTASLKGKLHDSENAVSYSAIFHDDGTFDIYYIGACNMDDSGSVCRTDSNELIELEFHLEGRWEYKQNVTTKIVYHNYGWPYSINYTYSQVEGTCILNVSESDFPGFQTGTITASYLINCDGQIFLLFFPESPVISMLFIEYN